jgi:phosphatidylglycerophosphatase A
MNIFKFIIKTISTFFYVGYLPLIPGTFASLAGAYLFYLLKDNLILYSAFTLGLLIIGFFITGKAENIFAQKDSRYIVIDEVTGMFLALTLVPYSFRILILGFFLFRILDTLKPYPANRIEHLKGSLGVMGDDIVAGLYTNIILQVAFRFISFKAS